MPPSLVVQDIPAPLPDDDEGEMLYMDTTNDDDISEGSFISLISQGSIRNML
jgi:hypothetical protein